MLNNIFPIGEFIPGIKTGGLRPFAHQLLTTQPTYSGTGFGKDLVEISRTSPVTYRPPKDYEGINNIATSVPVVTPTAEPAITTPTSSTSSVPVTIAPLLDEMEGDLKYWLGYNEGDTISMQLRQWADTRDEALRFMDWVVREKEGAIADGQKQQEQIARERDATQNLIDAAQREADSKKSQQNSTKNEIYNLGESPEGKEIKAIEAQIARVDGEISSLKGELDSLNSQVANAKSSPENKDSNENDSKGETEKLKQQAIDIKEKIRTKETEKRDLEVKKKELERKEQENKKQAVEKKEEIARIESEIKGLEEKVNNLKQQKDVQTSEISQIGDEIARKQQELERIQWIIADFRFGSSGMGL